MLHRMNGLCWFLGTSRVASWLHIEKLKIALSLRLGKVLLSQIGWGLLIIDSMQ